ncbi:hypothetical protein OAB40_04070 [Candidatus Pelagibacter ubique]|nr:hypothetical protein [Candidatus Pelagibacter ubique]
MSHNDLVRYVENSPKKGHHNYAMIKKNLSYSSINFFFHVYLCQLLKK